MKITKADTALIRAALNIGGRTKDRSSFVGSPAGMFGDMPFLSACQSPSAICATLCHSAERIARKAVTSGGSVPDDRISGTVPASSLLEPSAFNPNIIVNCTSRPLCGS